jgi:hypothetical protein
VNVEQLKTVSKNQIPQLAKELSAADVNFLVATLAEKDDTLRYTAFLLLQANSCQTPLVCRHWVILEEKLGSSNSYQRSIGLMLIAENVKWDKEGKFTKIIDMYLSYCVDEKFITARQAIQGLSGILNATSEYDGKISQVLTNLPLYKYKENQQKLLKKDTAGILKLIEKR